MNARNIVQTTVIVLMWVIVAFTLCILLTGCLELTRNEQLDEGKFRVKADCEKNQVEVELNLDRTDDRKKAEVSK